MKLNKEQLENLEKLAGLQFSIKEIAITLGVKPADLKKMIAVESSRAYIRYERGRIQVEAEVRKAIQQMAKQGSTPAQKQMMEIILRNKEELADLSSDKSRASKDKMEAQLKELEYKQKSGQLLDRDQVILAGQAVIAVVKKKLTSIPSRIAPQLVGEESIRKIKALLDKEIRESIKELTRMKDIV